MINFYKIYQPQAWQKNKNGGFTLVETLVAISIFTTSILALMSVLASGLTSTTYAKNKMIAGYLGQEGIEYIRNLRDTYALYTTASDGWVAFKDKITSIPECFNPQYGCYFDDSTVDFSIIPSTQAVTSLNFVACDGLCDPLKYDATTGRYNYVTGTPTNFVRTIHVVCPKNDCSTVDDVQVISDVSWKQGSGTYHVTFSEDLFNWIKP